MIDPSHRVNATHQFRYQSGDVLCFPLEKHERTWKFDTRNELGFYVGDKAGTKGAVLIYKPYEHTVVIRANTHRLQVSTMQLLQWYRRLKDVRSSPLPYRVVAEAAIDLLKDCTFDPPLPIPTDNIPTDNIPDPQETAIQQVADTTPPTGTATTRHPHDESNPAQPDIEVSPPGTTHRTRNHLTRRHYDPASDMTLLFPSPLRTPIDANIVPPLTPPIHTTLFHRPVRNLHSRIHNTLTTRPGTTINDAIHASLIDDNQNTDAPAAQILWNYNIETMHDPAPDDPNSEEIDTRKALHHSTHDRPQFIAARFLMVEPGRVVSELWMRLCRLRTGR
jgi:hypothetical protein